MDIPFWEICVIIIVDKILYIIINYIIGRARVYTAIPFRIWHNVPRIM